MLSSPLASGGVSTRFSMRAAASKSRSGWNASVMPPIDPSPSRYGSKPSARPRLANVEEVHRLLGELEGEEADIVRLYHLEGKSYHEISRETGVPAEFVAVTSANAAKICPSDTPPSVTAFVQFPVRGSSALLASQSNFSPSIRNPGSAA